MTKSKGIERKVLSVDILKENLYYDPLTGIFTRKISKANKVKVGDIVGALRIDGYVDVYVNGGAYLAHRLAWLYMTGEMPIELIDHKNGIRNDNRFCNLREATYMQNSHNITKLPKFNKSGYIGVYYSKQYKKWHSQISVNGKKINLGVFDTAKEASVVYLEAKRIHHPSSII